MLEDATVPDEPDDLTAAEAAARHGITAGEWLNYVRRRQAPRATGRRLGRPVWSPTAVDTWQRPTVPRWD